MTDFNKELCDEKHRNLEELVKTINTSIQSLYTRLNWFYLIAITTLVSSLSAILFSTLK
jgi:hypothetical protein